MSLWQLHSGALHITVAIPLASPGVALCTELHTRWHRGQFGKQAVHNAEGLVSPVSDCFSALSSLISFPPVPDQARCCTAHPDRS